MFCVPTAGHVAPELSALNCLVIEAKFGFMDLDRFPRGVEVVIPSSEFASFVDLNSSSSLFGARTLFIVNSGRMSVNVRPTLLYPTLFSSPIASFFIVCSCTESGLDLRKVAVSDLVSSSACLCVMPGPR